MKNLKYGIDFDGTIVDINSSKSRWIKDNLGMDVAPWKSDRTSCVPIIGLENYEKMSQVIYNRESTLNSSEIPGALNGILELSKKGKLYLVTMRHSQKLEFAKEWLAEHSALKYFSGFGIMKDDEGNKKNKEQVCREFNLGALVDDDDRHLSVIKIPNFKKILIKHGSNEDYSLPEDILLARNWEEVCKLI